MRLSSEDKVRIALSKETTVKKNYLEKFNKKFQGSGKDNYILGIKDDPVFWNEMYNDEYIQENGICRRVKPKIGPNHQIDLNKLPYPSK